MIFSSFNFILLFLPVVLLVYFLLIRCGLYNTAKLWLILQSFYFYAQGSPEFFWFFVGSVFCNYFVGMLLLGEKGSLFSSGWPRNLLFAAGILGNCALLGYYKYTDFFIENYNMLTGSDVALKHILLPIGISFFTFQLIAYLTDCYRGKAERYGILNYLLFITFFPQLIVGPIVHHKEMVVQYEEGRLLQPNFENIAKGIFLFSLGCAKKIMIADVLTTDAQSFFDALPSAIHCFDAWFYSFEYTISYYFDLSGYADMAIGLGLLFNIAIPRNFNSPYKARNFQDYWQRWHMTLSRFLSDYIFRNVYRHGSKYRSYYVAVMVTFFVSGFWHGAGWTFVVWGLVNGLFVCTASFMKRRGWSWPAPVSITLTMLFVVLLRVLFVAETFGDAALVYQAMLGMSVPVQGTLPAMAGYMTAFLAERISVAVTLAAGTAICWLAPNSGDLAERFQPDLRRWCISFALLAISLLYMSKVEVFLYFQF